MASLMRVPEVAAGATEVVLSEWLVDEGATVQLGAPVVVVETEKAIVEVESDASGVVLRRLAQASSTVEVGSALVLLGSEDERDADVDELLAGLGVGAATPAETAPEQEEQFEPEPDPEPEPDAEPEPHAEPEPEPRSERIFATPVARRVLAEGGVDIGSVSGTGPNGRILKKDAEAAVRSADEDPEPMTEPVTEPAPAASPTAGTGYTDVPHSRLRRAVATRLTASKQTVPHFYLRRSVRVDALLDLREQLNAVSPTRISVNDLVVRAVGAAHAATPAANVIWTDDALRGFDSVDVGVAIASERGLVTPVLRGVDSTSPSGIARAVRALVEQANEGRLQQRDLEGGSITVTNLGMYGVDDFAAIINPPQSAILAVGAAVATPVVEDGEVVVGRVMTLVLSVDHRAIDGALAAQWMAGLVQTLESPMALLA